MNLVTNRVSRILGKVENTERFLRVALYQGIPKQGIKTQRQLATTESSRAVTRQPTLLCTAFNKQRLYLFTTQEPDDSDQASTSRCSFASFAVSSPTHPFVHPLVAVLLGLAESIATLIAGVQTRHLMQPRQTHKVSRGSMPPPRQLQCWFANWLSFVSVLCLQRCVQ